jgi:hypothetical protein
LYHITQDQQDEFDRELAKMMLEDSRKADRRVALADVPLPMVKRQQKAAVTKEYSDSSDEDEEEQHMTFTLLTKKGNKQHVRCFVSMPTTLIAV